MKAKTMDNNFHSDTATGVYPFLATIFLFIIANITSSQLAAIATIANATVAILLNLPKIVVAWRNFKAWSKKKTRMK
jgi:anaerobic C4-dicarboxylate transporter